MTVKNNKVITNLHKNRNRRIVVIKLLMRKTKIKVKQRGNKNTGYDSVYIMVFLIGFILLMCFSKYMEEKFLKIKRINFG